MARKTKQYVCQECGHVSGRWSGKCDACGGWNTLREEAGASGIGASPQRLSSARKGTYIPLVDLSGPITAPSRFVTGIGELDRVTGGGFVPGSLVLVGGEPGIGKSTLLLQVAAALACCGTKTVYISGEEALEQIRMRAERLGLSSSPVGLACETCLENISAVLTRERPALAIIDSLQTLWTHQAEAAPGSVTQLRSCVHALIGLAKKTGTTLVIVGHVTKDGQIAGPRVVEHMVDAVLYFEGDGLQYYRILRGIKNRFGPTDEIGVFEMQEGGLCEVQNPSSLFLGDRDSAAPGSCVFAGIEGSRPLLIEIQALVAPSPFSAPRRSVVGWDANRLSMILAVLETRCKIPYARYDVYLNVAGGLRIKETAADLAVASALLSSLIEQALPPNLAIFGEISLSGAVRPVSRSEARLKEASKLGFEMAVMPRLKRASDTQQDIGQKEIRTLSELVSFIDPEQERIRGAEGEDPPDY